MAINESVKHYEKAPITEALLDIQFQGPDTTPEILAKLQAYEANAYTEMKPLFFAGIQLDDPRTGEGPAITTQAGIQQGWAFVAADKLQIWQIRKNGFTFSRLAPYQSWQPFRAEARRLWNLSRPVLKPEVLKRVAVRYVNRLELPATLKDFKEYLSTTPEIGPSLPQGLANFFMQLQIPQEDPKALLILNESLVPPLRPQPLKSISVVLDLDLIREAGLPGHEVPQDEEGLWNLFEQLHAKKNDIFEGCITDATRELIK